MNTKIAVGSDADDAVGMIDDTTYEQAIADELTARVETYGGVTAYCAAFNIERRNFTRYLRGTRTPTLPQLLRHLDHLQVQPGEFFDSVNDRIEVSE